MPRKSNADKRQEDLLELKQILVEKRDKILSHLKKIESDTSKGISDIGGDDADLASIELAQKTAARIGKREAKLLKKVDYALNKFGESDDTGEYGICELTGEDIPVARLKARPEAQYTVEAKEELERREGGYRDFEEDDSLDLDED